MTMQTMLSSTMEPAPAGVRSRLVAVAGALGRFPLAIHQLLFRFAIAGVFLTRECGLPRSALLWLRPGL